MFRHMVVYVGRSSVFTDSRFTEKLRSSLRTHEAHGWELVNAVARVGALGDITGIWLFLRRSAAIEDAEAA